MLNIIYSEQLLLLKHKLSDLNNQLYTALLKKRIFSGFGSVEFKLYSMLQNKK